MAAEKKRKPIKSAKTKSRPRKRVSPVELIAEARAPVQADLISVAVHAATGAMPPNNQAPANSGTLEPERSLLAFFAKVAEQADDREKECQERERILAEREKKLTEREKLAATAKSASGVREARIACATAGKALGIELPTPALVGGAMSDLGYRSETPPSRPTLKPVEVFRHILGELPAQIAPEINQELAKYRHPASTKKKSVAKPKARKSDTSATAAGRLKKHFDDRLRVLKNCHLAAEKKDGSRIARFLIGWGPVIFQDWPGWGDTTGGASILECLEQPPPPGK